jgi:hypothetical protein
MASHQVEIAIRKEISLKSDEYFEAAKPLAEIAKQAFGNQNKAQLNNLESIANGAMRVADILDFIKRQTGRSKQWGYIGFGPKLLQRLDESVRKDGQIILETFAKEKLDIADLRRIHILLCREFIRHLCAHYLYSLAIDSKFEDPKFEQ